MGIYSVHVRNDWLGGHLSPLVRLFSKVVEDSESDSPQDKDKVQETLSDLLGSALHTVLQLPDRNRQLRELKELAKAAMVADLETEFVEIMELMPDMTSQEVWEIGYALAGSGNTDLFKQFLRLSWHHPDSVYRICSWLAVLYPDQAGKIGKIMCDAIGN